ncbi:hypothetical protein HPB49_019483 [Dermacentor silvarum]|uniref:Uncharacterized protein n=1 Tax=Dermacentor silvarum TaxID=543639 RepID=A0ACB8DET1_DERSI|nr:hypothetical protein HPB49_019483 [Dermacentor silvarum]
MKPGVVVADEMFPEGAGPYTDLEETASKHCVGASAPHIIESPTKTTMLAGGGTSDQTREKENRPISGRHETTGCGTRNEEEEEETGALEVRSLGVGVQGSLVSRSVSSGSRPEPESLQAVPGEIHRA